MKHWFSKLVENFSYYVLIVMAVVDAVILTIDYGGWERTVFSTDKDRISLLLGNIAALSLAIGLERVIKFRQYDRQFEQLDELLARSLGAQYLTGHDETYQTINRLCNSAGEQIRALLNLVTPQFSAPPEWPKTIARRLKEADEQGKPARFDAVIACNLSDLPDNFREQMETRWAVYRRKQVDKFVFVYLTNITQVFGFDIFIIDRRHVIIALRSFAGGQQVKSAILFENQEKVASDFASWFDHFIREPAIPYESEE